MNGVLTLGRQLGEKLGAAEQIERPQRVETPVRPPIRKDIWPAEEWELMQRIRRGEEE